MLELLIPDMSCGHCVATITKTVKALDSEATVAADLARHTVTIAASVEPKQIADALEQAGYPATVA
nr:heavy-metal-associated domain-containing protein [uncultured Gellertiella sp.]